MNELQTLTAQRDEVLAQIREIETSCEGIENEHNAQRVQTLNLEQAQLNAQKQELSAKLSSINSRIAAINAEIAVLSGTGIDRILEAIKAQRWFYFRNKTKVLLDRDTGLLWNNPQYIPFCKPGNYSFSINEAVEMAQNLDADGFGNWKIATRVEYEKISSSSAGYPYYTGSNRQINNWSTAILDWSSAILDWNNREDYSDIRFWWTDEDWGRTTDHGIFIVFSRDLVQETEYEYNVSPNNPHYTEKERLQFTLDLFVQNDLLPIFDDEEITELFKKIYFEKHYPQLSEVNHKLDFLL